MFALFLQRSLPQRFLVKCLLFLIINRRPLVCFDLFLLRRRQLEKVAFVEGDNVGKVHREMPNDPIGESFEVAH